LDFLKLFFKYHKKLLFQASSAGIFEAMANTTELICPRDILTRSRATLAKPAQTLTRLQYASLSLSALIHKAFADTSRAGLRPN